MSKEIQLINEIRNVPILSAYSAISPFLQVRNSETDEPLPNLVQVNVQTGEAIVCDMEDDEAGGRRMKVDPKTGKVIQRVVFLDRKKYYIAFK